MSPLAFHRTDPGCEIAMASCDTGRLMLTAERAGQISVLRYALARPEGVTGLDIETALKAAAPETAEHARLGQTLPFLGATLGWFASTADGEARLAEAAERTAIDAVETQIAAAGFKPYLCLSGGKKVYARHLTASRSSNAFHLSVSPTGVELTFERATSSDVLLTLWLGGNQGRHVMPAFLADLEALVACAIAQADAVLASGRTGRRRKTV